MLSLAQSISETEKSAIQTTLFDASMLCKTSGWYNNCALNVLTHFLFSKLEKGELEHQFNNHSSYTELLTIFQEYYALSNTPSWSEITELLKTLVPTDREAILGPVLRQRVGDLIAAQPDYTWDKFASAAFSEFLKTGEAIDAFEAVYEANQEWFEDSLKEYTNQTQAIQESALSEEDLTIARIKWYESHDNEPSQEEFDEYALFLKKEAFLTYFTEQGKQQWIENGCERYANFVAILSNAVMITADHLQLLGDDLDIGIEIYTPNSIEYALMNPELAETTKGAFILPEAGRHWTLKAFNSGLHWMYQPEDEDGADLQNFIDNHNFYYPSEFFKEYSASDGWSGKFKIYREDADSDDSLLLKINTHVRGFFGLVDHDQALDSASNEISSKPSKMNIFATIYSSSINILSRFAYGSQSLQSDAHANGKKRKLDKENNKNSNTENIKRVKRF